MTANRPALLALLFAGIGLELAAQSGHEGHEMASTEEVAAGHDRVRIIDSPGTNTLTIELGPIDLPAGVSHHELDQIPVQEARLPFDFTIRGVFADAVDEDGQPVPRQVLHHANLLDPGRRELFLPIMLRVMASSHETPRVSVPGWLFGIPMRGGSPVLALAMLHNPTENDYSGVRVRILLEYERRARLPVYPIIPFHLDTMFPNAARKAFDLPPGEYSRSFEGRPSVTGLVLGLSGHLHQYATRLTLENVTTGEILYDVVPTTDGAGHIEEIPVLLHRGKGLGARLERDHLYRVTAEYYNPTGETIVDGGMGAVAGAFLPMGDWPAADPYHPLYREDYEWVLMSQLEHGEAGHMHGTSNSNREGRR